MIDRYTKAVLTVIAAALVALVGQNAIGGASAQDEPCGRYKISPCYVEATSVTGMSVFVTNQR